MAVAAPSSAVLEAVQRAAVRVLDSAERDHLLARQVALERGEDPARVDTLKARTPASCPSASSWTANSTLAVFAWP